MDVLQGINNYVRQELDSLNSESEFIRVQFRDTCGNATKWLSIKRDIFMEIKTKLILNKEGEEILKMLRGGN